MCGSAAMTKARGSRPGGSAPGVSFWRTGTPCAGRLKGVVNQCSIEPLFFPPRRFRGESFPNTSIGIIYSTSKESDNLKYKFFTFAEKIIKPISKVILALNKLRTYYFSYFIIINLNNYKNEINLYDQNNMLCVYLKFKI